MIKEKKVIGKRKKHALVFAVTVIVLGALSAILLPIINRYENTEADEPTNRYSDELHSYIFYTPDYDLDVTTVPEYMELDRMLYYKYGAEEYGIDGNAEDYGRDVAFFADYFDIVIAGKWEEYNELFTDHYYEKEKPRNQFAPQMIYDMHIEKLWAGADDGENKYAYNVSYRIYRNDGTFRNDLDEGASKVLYFELVEDGGELKIDYIDYYKPN